MNGGSFFLLIIFLLIVLFIVIIAVVINSIMKTNHAFDRLNEMDADLYSPDLVLYNYIKQ